MSFKEESATYSPKSRQPFKPVVGVSDWRGWKYAAATPRQRELTPAVHTIAFAFIGGGRVARTFRDEAGARAFCEQQNARDRALRGQGGDTPEPPKRVAVKPVEGIADTRGWVFGSSAVKSLPHSHYQAHAYIAGHRVERFFRDEESAREFCLSQNARDRAARGEPLEEVEPLLTWRELAARLHCCLDTIHERRKHGMPSIRLSRRDIRYRWSEVHAWLEAGRVKVQLPEQPFTVKPCVKGANRFVVDGLRNRERERRFFRMEKEANDYARKRNSAAGRAALAPLPIYVKGMDPEGPLWNVAPVDSARGQLFRAYAHFPKGEGDTRTPVKEHKFRTVEEALHCANRENLKVQIEIARRAAEAEEIAPAPRRPASINAGSPGVWTEAQMEGIDTRHKSDPMKGPPYRLHACKHPLYQFVVVGRLPGVKKRERKYFASERQAKTFAHMRNTQAREQGLESLTTPTWLRVMAERCQRLLAPHGKSIEEATTFFVEHLERVKKSCPVSELTARLLKSRKCMDVSKGYVGNLRRFLGRFGTYIGPETMVSEITTPQVEAFLNSDPKWGPTTRNNFRGHLSTFFNFGKAQGLCTTNPADAAATARQIEVPVAIFTPEQARQLLAVTPPASCRFLPSALFAGLRKFRAAAARLVADRPGGRLHRGDRQKREERPAAAW